MKDRAVAESYAQEHALTFIAKREVPFRAPTLGAGQRVVNVMSGAIAGGPPGWLCQCVDLRGFRLPFAQYEIPGLRDVVDGLWVRKSGRSIWTRVRLPRRYTELLLPSEAFNARYRVAIASERDEGVARRVLSGDLLVWLTDHVLQERRSDIGTSFEVLHGLLFIRGPFYAFNGTETLHAFAVAAARIATEVAALATRPAPTSWVASHAWECDICGGAAGSVVLSGRGELRRESFISSLARALADPALDRLRAALIAGDAAAVHALDPEFAPWWCPTCRKSYCGDHWLLWNVFDEEEPNWHDSIRGRCPKGHELMLED